MKLLLDTHVLLWMGEDSEQLSAGAKSLLSADTSELVLSVACAWEVAIKHGAGKLTLPGTFRQFVEGAITRGRMSVLPITMVHLERVDALSHHHRDPFDRLLVAQALVEHLPILSRDDRLDAYGIERLW